MADKWHTNDNDFTNDLVHISVNGQLYDMADTYARAQLLKKLDTPETNGKDGQVLSYTENGPVWADAAENSTAEEVAEYSAFEVMPNKTTITAGMTDTDTGLAYRFDIAACTIHKMTLRSSQEPEDCDVVIDWGDGTVEAIKDNKFVSHSAGKSYELAHDYAEAMTADTQKFIVKIYGKNYYTFRNNSYKKNNLMSRIFEADLPIASHIRNFASMAIGATRLLKVQFPHSTIPFTEVFNWSSCFTGCTNLISITGFEDIHIKEDAILNGIFQESGLVTTDFVFPTGITKMLNTFTICTSLEMNIEDLFPEEGFGASKIDIRSPFHATYKLKGTVPAHILWANKRTKWNILPYVTSGGTYMPFSSSDAAIKAQVPQSWGGTNTSIDAQLAVTDEMKADCTVFEVYPTDHDIVAGSSEIGKAVWNDESLITTYNITASMTEEFSLKITRAAKNSDIIIDWGDGTAERLSDISTVGGDTTSVIDETVVLAHTYSVPNKVYTICVYGKDYRSIRHTSISNANNKLLCRIFNDDNCDLTIASHLTNLSSFCIGCTRLLKVDNPEYSNKLQRLINIASLFEGCKNLLYAYGFKYVSNAIIDGGINNVFSGCNGLLETDFKLPTVFTSARNLFYNCERLEIDIASVFSNGSVSNATIDPAGMFAGTKKLFGIVPAKKLWKNTNVTWKTYSSDVLNGGKPFVQSSEEIRTQVPASWGGTAAEYVNPSSWVKIPTPSNMSTDDHFYELNIYFADNDQFTDAVQFTHKDCDIFNPATGLWMTCPEQGVDVAMSDSLVRIQSIGDKPYVKYCWVRDGVATLPWHTL